MHGAIGRRQSAAEIRLCKRLLVPDIEDLVEKAVEAARNDSSSALMTYLRRGVEADARSKSLYGHNRTLLHFAAARNSIQCLDLLIFKKADVNAIDDLGRTPLFLAARNGQVEAVRNLIAAGADKSIEDKSGQLASDLAASGREFGIVETLGGAITDEGKLQEELERKHAISGIRRQLSFSRSGNRGARSVGRSDIIIKQNQKSMAMLFTVQIVLGMMQCE